MGINPVLARLQEMEKDQIIEKYLELGFTDYTLAKALGISLLSDARAEVDRYLQQKKIAQAKSAVSEIRDCFPKALNFTERLLEQGPGPGEDITAFEECLEHLIDSVKVLEKVIDGLEAAREREKRK